MSALVLLMLCSMHFSGIKGFPVLPLLINDDDSDEV